MLHMSFVLTRAEIVWVLAVGAVLAGLRINVLIRRTERRQALRRTRARTYDKFGEQQ